MVQKKKQDDDATIKNMKEKVFEVLHETGFAESRSRTMDIDSFLK